MVKHAQRRHVQQTRGARHKKSGSQIYARHIYTYTHATLYNTLYARHTGFPQIVMSKRELSWLECDNDRYLNCVHHEIQRYEEYHKDDTSTHSFSVIGSRTHYSQSHWTIQIVLCCASFLACMFFQIYHIGFGFNTAVLTNYWICF